MRRPYDDFAMMLLVLLNIIYLTPVRAVETIGSAPPAPVTYLALERAARRRTKPISEHGASTLLAAARSYAAELGAEHLAVDLRVSLIHKLGELIATAWTDEPPPLDQELPAALFRLLREARATDASVRAAGDSTLRMIVATLDRHVHSGPAPTRGAAERAERAIETLSRINHPAAVAALLAVARGTPSPAGMLAAERLGQLAWRRSRDRYAEFCAGLLLE